MVSLDGGFLKMICGSHGASLRLRSAGLAPGAQFVVSDPEIMGGDPVFSGYPRAGAHDRGLIALKGDGDGYCLTAILG